MKSVEYALTTMTGEIVTRNHQDDLETPLIAPSLLRLLESVAEAFDYDLDGLLGMFDDDNDLVIDGDTYCVVRRELESMAMNSGDLAYIKGLKEGN